MFSLSLFFQNSNKRKRATKQTTHTDDSLGTISEEDEEESQRLSSDEDEEEASPPFQPVDAPVSSSSEPTKKPVKYPISKYDIFSHLRGTPRVWKPKVIMEILFQSNSKLLYPCLTFDDGAAQAFDFYE